MPEASTFEALILVQGPTRQDRPSNVARRKLDKVIRTIKAHFPSRHRETEPILDLDLGHELRDGEFREIRRVLDETGVKYELDEYIHTLYISAMTIPIHDSLEEFALSCWLRLKSETFTSEEAKCLRAGVNSMRLDGNIKSKGTKRQARKVPRLSIGFL